jgi:hypothetical protein
MDVGFRVFRRVETCESLGIEKIEILVVEIGSFTR